MTVCYTTFCKFLPSIREKQMNMVMTILKMSCLTQCKLDLSFKRCIKACNDLEICSCSIFVFLRIAWDVVMFCLNNWILAPPIRLCPVVVPPQMLVLFPPPIINILLWKIPHIFFLTWTLFSCSNLSLSEWK